MTTNREKALKVDLSRSANSFINSIIKTDPKFFFVDRFVAELIEEGYPVLEVTRKWAISYTGSNTFVKDVANKVAPSKNPSLKQARGLLNCAVKDAQEKGTPSSEAPAAVRSEPVVAPSPPLPPREFECRSCGFRTTTIEEYREHRKLHYKPLFDGMPQSGIDLHEAPLGRYAVPMLDGSDYYFLSISRVHSKKERSKKFRYGWVSYGREEVAEGTLEIRKWSGETKELVGEQRPFETYRGNHLDEFKLILKDPIAATKLFALIHKRCGRCGTSLTDPTSRARGIGPECIKHYGAYDSDIINEDATEKSLTERLRKLRDAPDLVAKTPDRWAPVPAFPSPSPFVAVGAGVATVESEPELAPFGWH